MDGSSQRFQNVVKVNQHLLTSALAITIWDWLTCLNIEYFRIWRAKWTVAKVLYIFTRYWGMAAAAVSIWVVLPERTPDECSHIYKLVVILPTLAVFSSEIILAVRTYAFLGRDRRLLAVLAAMLLGELAYMIYVFISPNGLTQVPIHGSVGFCASSAPAGKTPNLNMGLFIAPAMFDFLVTFVTLAKAIQLWHEGLRSSWLQLFVREGLIYFIVLTTLNIVTMAFFLQPYQPLQPIIATPTRLISAVLACRLILSLRNPKVLGPARSISSSFYETGFETRHDHVGTASTVPVLPTTTNDVNGVGITSELGKSQADAPAHGKLEDPEEDDDDDGDDDDDDI